MKYLFLLLAFILPSYASAFTYERTPTGTEITSPVSINLTFEQADLSFDSDEGYEKWCILAYDDFSNVYSSQTVLKTAYPQIGNNLILNIPVGTVIQLVLAHGVLSGDDCSNDQNGIAFVDSLEVGANVFTIIASSNNLWGSSNGFWGDTTPSDITDTLQASVQATGLNIWPLIMFVGIPVAFLIAIYLLWLINKTLTPSKKSDDNVINPQGENLIYHNVDELEFKREYGQVKRKRGRPRKYPL